MASIGDLYYTFRGDGARLQADAKKEGEKAGDVAGKGFTSKFKKAFSGSDLKGGLMQGLGLGAGLGAAGALAAGIGTLTDQVFKSIDAASDLNEAVSKSEAVFGDSSAAMEDWAATAAEGFGQSKRQALEAAGTFGNLIQAFGIGGDKAADMSKTLVELASDLASFNNTSVDEAINALRSGLSGETEPLKRYGVALSDVRLREEALRLGLVKTTKGVLPIAIKTQAAYSLVLKDTALAQGDFARTSDGLANTQKTLAAKLEDAQAAFGEKLLPVVLAVTEKMLDLFDAMDKVAQGGEDNSDALINFGNVLSDLNQRGEESKTWIGAMDEELSNLADSFLELADDTLDSATFWDTYETVAAEALRKTAQSTDDLANVMDHRSGEIAGSLGTAGEAYGDLGDEAEETATDVETSTGRIITSADDLKSALMGDIAELIAGYYDPIQQRQQIQANNAEITAQKQILADENATTEQKRNARERITDLERGNLELGVKLLEAGKLSAKEQAALLADLQKKLQASKGPARAAIQAIIDKVRELTNLTGTGISVRVNYGNRPGSQARASGGPVSAGQSYLVGELGRELFVPDVPGTIIPSSQVAANTGGSTINVNLLDRMPAQSVRDIGAGLQMLELGGYLGPRTRSGVTVER